jgi:hypothetical protein
MWPAGLVLKAVLCVEVIDLDDDVTHLPKAEIGKVESRNRKVKSGNLENRKQKSTSALAFGAVDRSPRSRKNRNAESRKQKSSAFSFRPLDHCS